MSNLFAHPVTDGGVTRVVRRPIADSRGTFARLFDLASLDPLWAWPIAQVNLSRTHLRGTVRGLHFQYPPFSDAKLVTCIRGSVFDVAVDIRPDSTTFLQVFAQELSDSNGVAMLIPPGFAHGFQSLTSNVELLYIHSRPYAPAFESGLNAFDPDLGIGWPLPVSALSTRDEHLPLATALDLEKLGAQQNDM